jgi:hypothetical protein
VVPLELGLAAELLEAGLAAALELVGTTLPALLLSLPSLLLVLLLLSGRSALLPLVPLLLSVPSALLLSLPSALLLSVPSVPLLPSPPSLPLLLAAPSVGWLPSEPVVVLDWLILSELLPELLLVALSSLLDASV